MKRSTWATIRIRPARRAAAIMRSQSSPVSAMGFSTSTCLPASKAATATGACKWVGRQRSTASVSKSRRA